MNAPDYAVQKTLEIISDKASETFEDSGHSVPRML